MSNDNESFDTDSTLADSINEITSDMTDEEVIRRRAIEAAQREIEVRTRDLEHEAGGVDAERRDLLDYAAETGDPSVDSAIEDLKRVDLEIDVERRNLPPQDQ